MTTDLRQKLCTWGPVAGLVFLAVIVHIASFPGDYFVDDILIVEENPLVLSPDLRTIFRSDYWGPWSNTGLYRPLTILSFAVNRALLGHHPWGYHLVNLLLHSVVALSLCRFLKQIGVDQTAAWLAAALFAVHPIHGEPVNELVGRSELLVALFVLSGLSLALARVRCQGLWVCLCFAAALLSKEHGIVLLALLPVVDWYVGGRNLLQRRWKLYAALGCIAVGWGWYRVYGVLRTSDPPSSLDPIFVPLSTLGFAARHIAALKLQFVYLWKQLVPVELFGMYSTSYAVPAPSPVVAGLIISGALVALTLVMVGYVRRRLWGLAFLLYAISFAPTSNLVVLTAVTMADRLAYLPSVWFCFGLAALLQSAISKLPNRQRVLTVTGMMLLLCYAVLGTSRSLDFRAPELLWRQDLRQNRSSELSMLFLANELWRQGKLVEAENYYRELLSMAPRFSEGYRAYASFLIEKLDRPEEAITMANKALEYAQDVPHAYMPLAEAYYRLGRYRETIAALDECSASYEYTPSYWKLRGKVLEAVGDNIGAMVCYEQERARAGTNTHDVHLRMAGLAMKMNRFDKAEKILREELHVKQRADVWRKLEEVLRAQGRSGEAQNAMARAMELEGDVVSR